MLRLALVVIWASVTFALRSKGGHTYVILLERSDSQQHHRFSGEGGSRTFSGSSTLQQYLI